MCHCVKKLAQCNQVASISRPSRLSTYDKTNLSDFRRGKADCHKPVTVTSIMTEELTNQILIRLLDLYKRICGPIL